MAQLLKMLSKNDVIELFRCYGCDLANLTKNGGQMIIDSPVIKQMSELSRYWMRDMQKLFDMRITTLGNGKHRRYRCLFYMSN